MCTLIVFKDMCDGYPLVIAANRDEVPTRPTEGPMERDHGIFAPRDLVHGGSWIGVNRRGLTAALTNRSWTLRHRGRRSRGLLITEALAFKDAGSAARAAMSAAPDTYNGFQMVLADGRETTCVWSDGAGLYRRPLESGLHVLTGDGCEPGHSDRDALIRERVRQGARPDDPEWLDRLLSFHGPGPESGTCAHGHGIRMESIFSMTIHLPSEADRLRLRWRQGRPCLGGVWEEKDIVITRNPKERT